MIVDTLYRSQTCLFLDVNLSAPKSLESYLIIHVHVAELGFIIDLDL